MKLVYVLDDSPEFLILIQKLLVPIPCVVKVFENADSFIGQFKEVKPDLCLIDNDLGNEHRDEGMILSRALKEKKNDHIKVVMISSSKDPNLIKRSYNIKVDDYLTKPLDKDLFLTKISVLLGIKSDVQNMPVRLLEHPYGIRSSVSGNLVELTEWDIVIETTHFVRPNACVEIDCPFLRELIKKYSLCFRVVDCVADGNEDSVFRLRLNFVVAESMSNLLFIDLRRKLNVLPRSYSRTVLNIL